MKREKHTWKAKVTQNSCRDAIPLQRVLQSKPRIGKLKKKEKGIDKKGVNGRLKKNFFDAEAELSGSEDEFSEDEDEKGLDRLD